MMNFAGFFVELDEGHENAPSIDDVRGAMPAELVSSAAAYLSRGIVLASARMMLRDHFAENKVICSLSELTDGTWVWPSSLPYYVTNYQVGLPAEFIQHMRQMKWVPPRLSDVKLAALRRTRRNRPTF